MAATSTGFAPSTSTSVGPRAHGTGRVQHMERLGSDAILHLDANGVGPLTVRTDGETDVTIGETVFATPRPGREHRFRAGARL